MRRPAAGGAGLVLVPGAPARTACSRSSSRPDAGSWPGKAWPSAAGLLRCAPGPPVKCRGPRPPRW